MSLPMSTNNYLEAVSLVDKKEVGQELKAKWDKTSWLDSYFFWGRSVSYNFTNPPPSLASISEA